MVKLPSPISSALRLFGDAVLGLPKTEFRGYFRREDILNDLPRTFGLSEAAAYVINSNRAAFRGQLVPIVRKYKSERGGSRTDDRRYSFEDNPNYSLAADLLTGLLMGENDTKPEPDHNGEVFIIEDGVLRKDPLKPAEMGRIFLEGAHLLVFGTETSHEKARETVREYSTLNHVDSVCFIRTGLEISDWLPSPDKRLAPARLEAKVGRTVATLNYVLPLMAAYNTIALATGRTPSACCAHSGGCAAAVMALSTCSSSSLLNLRMGLFAPIIPRSLEPLMHEAKANGSIKLRAFHGENDIVRRGAEQVNVHLDRFYGEMRDRRATDHDKRIDTGHSFESMLRAVNEIGPMSEVLDLAPFQEKGYFELMDFAKVGEHGRIRPFNDSHAVVKGKKKAAGTVTRKGTPKGYVPRPTKSPGGRPRSASR